MYVQNPNSTLPKVDDGNDVGLSIEHRKNRGERKIGKRW